ncbi:unnamed protein product [Meganyctiphanes norvegica]|uniref:Uncharacterized protein n=1 Tax=Meganyctiphanes norvegica TaxID=48144 RepID=A0AAV2QLV4_MEGNR
MEWSQSTQQQQQGIARVLLSVVFSVAMLRSVASQDAAAAFSYDDNTTRAHKTSQLPESQTLMEKEGAYTATLSIDSRGIIQNDVPKDDLAVTSPQKKIVKREQPTTASVNIGPCDYLGKCESKIICGCSYKMRPTTTYVGKWGRRRNTSCQKIFDCSTEKLSEILRNIKVNDVNDTSLEKLTYESLLNINFADVNDTIFDVNFHGHKLKAEDIDILGQRVHQKTSTSDSKLDFLLSTAASCGTRTRIIRNPYVKTFLTRVNCGDRNLTDNDIENINFPASTERLELQKNKLEETFRLEKILDSLPHLVEVDLSNNKLTAIPKINVTQKMGPYFIMNLDNNDIRKYDSVTLAQYADDTDSIEIRIANNAFICDCEAYYTNEVYVQQSSNYKGGELTCSQLDENTGEKLRRKIPPKADEYWRNKCESSEFLLLYLIFTWHNCLDAFLVIGNLFFIYVIYDLYMASRELRAMRGETKKEKRERRESTRSIKSNKKESTAGLSSRKISMFSRKGSKAESEVHKINAHTPRRPLFDVIVCTLNHGYENIYMFIHSKVLKKKEVPEENDKRDTLEKRESNHLRDQRLERMFRNSQNYDTRL